MKQLGLFIAAMLLTIASIAQNKIPTVAVKDANDNTVKFNTAIASGEVTVVSFWASWCIPCKKEMKQIKEKYAQLQSEGAKFKYVLVSTDKANAVTAAKTYIKNQGLDQFNHYYSTDDAMKNALGFQNVPYTIVVDKKGNIVYSHSGFDDAAFEKMVEKVKAHNK